MGSVSCQQPPLTNQLSFSPEFGSSAWFSTQFRELSFTAVCDPWKQLWLKGVTTVPSTAPWNWHGCPNVPQNCCSGKLWPSSHNRCLIFIYTGLVTALSNASTHPAGIIVIFSPSNSSKAFRQATKYLFFCLFVFRFLFKLLNTQSLDLRDESWCDRGTAECTDRCKLICRSAAPWHSSWLRSSLRSCIYFHCATNHLILWLLGLAIFQHKYKPRQGQLVFAQFSVVVVSWAIKNQNCWLRICFGRKLSGGTQLWVNSELGSCFLYSPLFLL